MSMLSYVTLGTNDLSRATAFYDAVTGALGYVRSYRGDSEVAYGAPGKFSSLWVVSPFNEAAASAGNGTMVTLIARSRAAVDAFHAAALAQGGTDEGAPGLRSYDPNFYGAYVRDPDGNKLAAACLKPE